MNTVILKWNPSFSSYPMKSFLNDMTDVEEGYGDFDWSVWDHDKIHPGDECFWLKVGYGQTGIVGHGIITSEPFEGEDWSGKGRQTFYVKFDPDIMICPDAYRLLTSDTLQEAIPDFDWHAGHSGLVLDDQQAAALRQLWKEYLDANKEAFEKDDSGNIAMKRLIDATVYDDGTVSVQALISNEKLEVTVRDTGLETQITVWNTESTLKAFGCSSFEKMLEVIKKRYAHPHAITILSQDLLRLHISYDLTFDDDSDDD